MTALKASTKPGVLEQLNKISDIWKFIWALVGIVLLGQTALNYFGPPRTTPAQAIKELTVQMNSRDSAQSEYNAAMQKALLQNSYSICIIAKRPQGECADVILNSNLRAPAR